MATWLITGASRGLGRAIALHALSVGDDVVATARSTDALTTAFAGAAGYHDRFMAVELDVTDPAQASSAVAKAVARFGAIDVLVNNAGRGLLGAVEEASGSETEAVFATNVFGLLHVTRAVLPHLRAARSGHIVNIGSMGGFAQVAGWGVYGATKFAVEGISESLRAELAPLGIRVTIVEPGSFRTDFLGGDSLQQTETELADYTATAGRVRRAVTAAAGRQPNDPARGAAAIYAAVTSEAPPFRLPLGADAVAMVEGKLAGVHEELQAWRALASSTAIEAEADATQP